MNLGQCEKCGVKLAKRKSKYGMICRRCQRHEYYLNNQQAIKARVSENDRRNSGKNLVDKVERTCIVCSKIFFANKRHHICSDDCRSKRAQQQSHDGYHKRRERILKQIREHKRKFREENGFSKNTLWRRTKLNERLAHSLRVRLKNSLKGIVKQRTTLDLIGCDLEMLKLHLESKFQTGMSWSNYGRNGWHIDHVIPLASFDLSDPNQLKTACHYSNLQPLWCVDNLSKGKKEFL